MGQILKMGHFFPKMGQILKMGQKLKIWSARHMRVKYALSARESCAGICASFTNDARASNARGYAWYTGGQYCETSVANYFTITAVCRDAISDTSEGYPDMASALGVKLTPLEDKMPFAVSWHSYDKTNPMIYLAVLDVWPVCLLPLRDSGGEASSQTASPCILQWRKGSQGEARRKRYCLIISMLHCT